MQVDDDRVLSRLIVEEGNAESVLRIFRSVLGVDGKPRHGRGHADPLKELESLEISARRLVEQGDNSGQSLPPDLNYEKFWAALRRAWQRKYAVSLKHSLDFEAELWAHEPLFSQEGFPALYRLFVALPRDKGWGVERENHGFGYHIHYVKVQKERAERSDALFTFNPMEPVSAVAPTLYWEHHNEGAQVRVAPDSFGKRRRLAIYDVCESFQEKVGKENFRRLSKESTRFHP